MKFKLEFTIEGALLFGMLAKFLPVEELSVEEIPEGPPQLNEGPPPIDIEWPTYPRSTEWPTYPTSTEYPSTKRPPRNIKGVRKPVPIKEYAYSGNLFAGTNGVIMSVLADGEAHTGAEMTPAMKAANLKSSGVYSRLIALMRHGFIEMAGNKWRLTYKGREAWMAKPSTDQA